MRELHKRIAAKMTVSTTNDASHALRETRQGIPLARRIVSVLDVTKEVLERSGVVRGMRVLDLGCGTGDTSLLTAKLVGPSGLVVGLDSSAEAIDLAQRRATMAGQCYWMRFVCIDIEAFVADQAFDAVIVRPDLIRSRDAAAMFDWLSNYLRPDGAIILASGKPDQGKGRARRCDGAFEISVTHSR
ncbi:class I SAM-dependent methyltransferase [Bradyrhizobium sp. USDA 10063]